MEVKEKLEKFIDSSSKVEFLSLLKNEAKTLKEKLEKGQLNIVLVGEFSSGKTSLINALYDLNLPTDVLPKTASIWRIITTKGENKILVHYTNDKTKELNDIEEIENIQPEDIKYIDYYVNSGMEDGLVIVDTPGLSSIDDLHREILENFIEKADILLIVTDINQGLTNSTKKFIEEKSKDKLKSYVVITKVDVKPPDSTQNMKKYIKNNFNDFIADVVAVSVNTNNLEELKTLLDKIGKEKERLLNEIINKRLQQLCKEASQLVSFQLENANLNVEEIDNKKKELERKLDKVEEELKHKKKEIDNQINRIIDKSVAVFLNTLRSKVDYIVEALYDDNLKESIEHRFDLVVKESIEKAIQELEKDLKKTISDIEVLSNNLQKKLDIGKDISIVIAEKLVNLREFLAKGAKVLLERISVRGERLGKFSHVFESVLSELIKGATISFVRSKVNKVINSPNTENTFREEIENALKEVFDEIWKSLIKDLEETRENYFAAIEEIKKEKEKKREEFLNYIETLKKLRYEFDACGGI